jgi:hypothetical protein
VGIGAPDLLGGTSDYRRCTLAAIADAGVGIIRQPFRWSQIEVRRGQYRFARYDDLVAAAARFGLGVLPVLIDPPRFRRGHGLTPRASALAAFAGRLARRYGPGGTLWSERPEVTAQPVTAWQVWDAPNLRSSWRARPSAARYTQLLRAVRRALRARDARATVVTGGLAQAGAGVSASRFEAALAHRRRGAWDVLGLAPSSPSASNVLRFVDRARRALDRGTARGAPLWVTGLAWADGGRRGRLRVGGPGQAARIQRVLSRLGARRAKLGLRGVVYSAWRDAGRRRTGLLNVSGSPKPAFQAFVAAATSLR